MQRHKVNLTYLTQLLAPIVGGADDDERCELYSDLQGDDEPAVRAVLRRDFLPAFAARSKRARDGMLLALQYSLSTEDTDFVQVFNSCMPPFDPPTVPRNFFLWLWQELCPRTDYLIRDLTPYDVVSNPYESNER